MVPALEGGGDGVPVRRRADAAAAGRGLDPPPGPARGGLLPDAGRLLRALGARRRRLRGVAAGPRAGVQRRQLAVAELHGLLFAVLPLLQPGRLRAEVGQEGRVRAEVGAGAEGLGREVHIRAVES